MFFKAKNSEYCNSYLKMLSLCRLEDEGESLSQAYDLVTAKDRDDLWKLKSNALSIFITTENQVTSQTHKRPKFPIFLYQSTKKNRKYRSVHVARACVRHFSLNFLVFCMKLGIHKRR